MIKNLVVTNIPKSEIDLKRLLHKLGDHSWHEDAIKEFSWSDNLTLIWYCHKYETYLMGNKITLHSDHKFVTFEECLSDL